MSDKRLNLKIITPEKILVDEDVNSMASLTVDGEVGILPEHLPYMTALDIGVTRYRHDGKREYVATIGGILQVEDNKVIILTDAADRGEEIDVPRARAAKERAEARLGTGVKDVDHDRAQAALARAMARMKAATKMHHI